MVAERERRELFFFLFPFCIFGHSDGVVKLLIRYPPRSKEDLAINYYVL
jgi:hypothetical protein